MYCRLYIIVLITIWAFAERVSSQDCDSIQFNEYSLDDTKIYSTNTTVKMTWYSAVCCCRKRGWELLTPISTTYLDKVKDVVHPLVFGWVAIYHNNGQWRYLQTGENLADGLIDPNFADTKNSYPGECAELTHNFRLNKFKCEKLADEGFICESKWANFETCPVNAGTGKVCKTDEPILVAVESQCQRRGPTTTAPPPTTTTTTTPPPTTTTTTTPPPTTTTTTTPPPPTTTTTTPPPPTTPTTTPPPTTTTTTTPPPTATTTTTPPPATTTTTTPPPPTTTTTTPPPTAAAATTAPEETPASSSSDCGGCCSWCYFWNMISNC